MNPKSLSFPRLEKTPMNRMFKIENSLTIRDYIAIEAMKGMLAREIWENSVLEREEISRGAYKIADALIFESKR